MKSKSIGRTNMFKSMQLRRFKVPFLLAAFAQACLAEEGGEEQFLIVATAIENPPALRLEVKCTAGSEPVLVEWYQAGGIECDVVLDGDDPSDVRVEKIELGRSRVGPASYVMLPPQQKQVSTVGGVFVVRVPLEGKVTAAQLADSKCKVRLRFLKLSSLASPASPSSESGGVFKALKPWASKWVSVSGGK